MAQFDFENFDGSMKVSANGALVSGTNPLPIYDGYQNPVAVAWTNATAQNTAAAYATSGYDTIVITLVSTGTISGGVVTFEVFDGVTWLPIKGFRPDSYLSDSAFTLATGTSRSWQFSIAGFTQFRTRLSTVISGTGSVSVTTIVSSAPDVSGVTVGIDPNAPLPTGTNTLGGVLMATSATAGAPTLARVMSAATTNATSVKASSGNLYAVQLFNTAGSTRFVKLYNKASAPTVGTDTPIATLPIAAGAWMPTISQYPVSFSVGIAYAITGAVGDSDTTAVGANDVVGFLQYA